MKLKTLAMLMLMLFANSLLFAQDVEPKNENYSESKSYRPERTQPTRFVKKPKKNKKEKKDKNEEAKIIDVAENSPTNNQKAVQNNKVSIPISVYNEQGVIVNDIKQTEIELFENGEKQEIKGFGNGKEDFNIIFLVDLSLSTENLLKDLQNGLKQFVQTSDKRYNIILTGFNKNFEVFSDENDIQENLLKSIKKLKSEGGSSVYNAIGNLNSDVLKNLQSQNIVVFISDAVDTTSNSNYEKSLEIAEESNSQFIGVYLNNLENRKKLKLAVRRLRNEALNGGTFGNLANTLANALEITEEEYLIGYQYIYELTASTGGSVYEVGTEKNAFESVFKEVQNKINQQNFIQYESNSDSGGRKEIKVRVLRPNLTVRIRDNYNLN